MWEALRRTVAIHIRKLGQVRERLRRMDVRNRFCALLSGVFVVLGIAFILFSIVIFVMKDDEAHFIVYQPSETQDLPQEAPMAQLPSTRTFVAAPPVPNIVPVIVVSEDILPVELPSIEQSADWLLALDMEGDLTSEALSDLKDGADDAANSDSEAEGDSGGGLGTKDGGGFALEGTFYDLKMLADTRPSGVRGNALGISQVHAILQRFFDNDWSPRELDKYYRAKQKLYASFFFLPVARAEYGPISYECDDVCRPSAWVAVYRGKVRAPKSGTFRFIGTGDDTLAVRFNNEMVLEAGYLVPSIRGANARINGRWPQYEFELREGRHPGQKGYELLRLKGINRWNREIGGMTAGRKISVVEGHVYPIEILISEIPGHLFGFMLLMEDMSEKLPKLNPNNRYNLFRTNHSKPNESKILKLLRQERCDYRGHLEIPPYNADSPVWQVVP